jgi:hypothetical protein
MLSVQAAPMGVMLHSCLVGGEHAITWFWSWSSMRGVAGEIRKNRGGWFFYINSFFWVELVWSGLFWSDLVSIIFFIHLLPGRVYRVLGLILGESGQVWSIVYCTILLLLLTRLTQDQFQYSLYPLQEKERKKKYTDQT